MSQSLRAWVVCLTAGLFFFYEFIQMNMFNVISSDFMQAFHLSAQLMGWIDSFYFAANVIFLLLAGYLLDHFSIRRVILLSMLLCVIGTVLLSFTHLTSLAMLFRFITGIGSAFCFLSCIRLATHWFPEKKLGLVIGVILTEAMIGGVFSQTPLTLLVKALGWRMALLVDGLIGIALWIIIYWVVRDRPNHACVSDQDMTRPALSYWHGFRQAFSKSHNWLAALYTGLTNIPMALLGGLWGITYLVTRFHITRVEASLVTTFLFIGMMLGSPALGWLSDRVKSRKSLMLVGAACLVVVLFALIQVDHWSYAALLFGFLLVGFISGSQVISYPLVAQASPAAVVAMSVSVVNITTQGIMGLSRPFSGWLVDRHETFFHPSSHHIVLSDYIWVMWSMPIAVVAGMASIVFIKKRMANRSYDDAAA